MVFGEGLFADDNWVLLKHNGSVVVCINHIYNVRQFVNLFSDTGFWLSKWRLFCRAVDELGLR